MGVMFFLRRLFTHATGQEKTRAVARVVECLSARIVAPIDHGVGTVAIVCRMRLAMAYGSPWEFGRRSSTYPL
jgi:hypothetical protein